MMAEPDNRFQANPAAATMTRPTATPATMARLRFGDRPEPRGGPAEAAGGGAIGGATGGGVTGVAAIGGATGGGATGGGVTTGGGSMGAASTGRGVTTGTGGAGSVTAGDGAAGLSVPQFTQNLVAAAMGSPQFTQNRLGLVSFISRSLAFGRFPAMTCAQPPELWTIGAGASLGGTFVFAVWVNFPVAFEYVYVTFS